MTVTAEEKGLLGSEYYTNHPVFSFAEYDGEFKHRYDWQGRSGP
jgi:Zn-dependent M28 family amino/carboxypeptidase